MAGPKAPRSIDWNKSDYELFRDHLHEMKNDLCQDVACSAMYTISLFVSLVRSLASTLALASSLSLSLSALSVCLCLSLKISSLPAKKSKAATLAQLPLEANVAAVIWYVGGCRQLSCSGHWEAWIYMVSTNL